MTKRPAFTIIEIMLALSIIGTMASIVIAAVNPQLQLSNAHEAQRAASARAIENAIWQYQIDRGSLPDAKTPDDLSENSMSICREDNGLTYCYDLSALTPGYLASLPVDPAEPADSATIGYSVYMGTGNRPSVLPLHVGNAGSGGPTDYEARFAFAEGPGNATTVSSLTSYIGSLTGFDIQTEWSTDVPNTSYSNAYSLAFDGADNVVEVGDYFDLGTDDLTISAWFKTSAPSEESQDMYIASKSGTSDDGIDGRYAIGIAYGVFYGVIDLAANDSSHNSFNSSIIGSRASVNDGVWHHGAMVIDRDDAATLYLDGAFDGALDISLGDGIDYDINIPFRIGAYTNDDNVTARLEFDGLIDDVRIYKRALSTSEITALAAGR